MTCLRCSGPRPRGKGRRYCSACAVVSYSESQEKAMARFISNDPDYWKRYYQERKRREA